jgi:hypothetical protein
METIIKFQSPSKGDVIWVFRSLYFHCGVYEGDNSVIHFAPQENNNKSKEDAFIHRTSLEKFADGFPVSTIEFTSEECFLPDEVVSRACSRLNEKGYNLPFNNCDHFATWCKTGKHRSIKCQLNEIILNWLGNVLDIKENKCKNYKENRLWINQFQGLLERQVF